MIRLFASKAVFFAVSVIAFSFFRQILFFPTLARLDEATFVAISFLVFAFEAIAYGLTGALPDYYVRETRGKGADPLLLSGLVRLSSLAFPMGLLLWAMGLSLASTAVLAVYLWLFAVNALRLKVLFNELRFGENYIYVGFRLAPYAVTFGLFWLLPKLGVDRLSPEITGTVFAALLCCFEALYALRLRAIVGHIMGPSSSPGAPANSLGFESLRNLAFITAPFIAAYILSGVAQRGDLIAIKYLAEQVYVDYAKLYIVVNFFCSPLVIAAANPLMSIINKENFKLRSEVLWKIIAGMAAVALLAAGAAAAISDIIYGLLYIDVLRFSRTFIFTLVVFTISYGIFRTLAMSFASPFLIAAGNALSVACIVLGLLLTPSVEFAILFFYVFRTFTHIGMLLLVPKS